MSDEIRSRTAALTGLRRELTARGFGRKAPGRVVIELAVHVVLAVGGLIVFFASDSVLLRILGLLVSTLGSMGVGTNTHTSSHYATSDHRWVNEALTFFGYPLFLGLSATFWWNKHVVVHHPAPNVIDVDDDADFMPWLALTDRDLGRVGSWRRFYYLRLQWWVFPIVLAGNGFNMGRAGWMYAIGCLRDASIRKRVHWIDFGCLVLHLGIYIGVPALFVPIGDAIVGYALRITLMGYALFAVLGPGHLPAEAARLSADQKDAEYLLRQTATTINFTTGTFGRFLCSGLEYQIEHHLFPNLTHTHYPKVAPIVEEFCRVHALPYRTYSWPVALWKCWIVLRTPRAIETDLESAAMAQRL